MEHSLRTTHTLDHTQNTYLNSSQWIKVTKTALSEHSKTKPTLITSEFKGPSTGE